MKYWSGIIRKTRGVILKENRNPRKLKADEYDNKPFWLGSQLFYYHQVDGASDESENVQPAE